MYAQATLLLKVTSRNTAHLIQRSHRCTRRGYHVVDKEEESIFRAEVYPLANQKIELANGQV